MVIAGEASAELLVSSEPLSFWGGYDARTGEIIDKRHPLAGKNAAGKILVVPFTRGSSTTTQVLLEAIRAGTAPAAIISSEADTFLALAAIVADEMYGRVLPIAVVSETDMSSLRSGAHGTLTSHGLVQVLAIT
jgi:predicted aconitase with swiveling domain